MKNSIRQLVFASLFFLTGASGGFGQILDFNRASPYQRVFVDTDAYGTGYLQSLEEGLNHPALEKAVQSRKPDKQESPTLLDGGFDLINLI